MGLKDALRLLDAVRFEARRLGIITNDSPVLYWNHTKDEECKIATPLVCCSLESYVCQLERTDGVNRELGRERDDHN